MSAAKGHTEDLRTAIITGGTSGIGLAAARSLLGRGHTVFVCGRDPRRLASALERLQDEGTGRVGGGVCDVRDLASAEAMVAAAVDQFGAVDALINSAGIGFIIPFERLEPQQWRDILDTNLTGVYNCCRAVLPALKRTGRGDIINLGSRAGRYAFAGGVGYNTTKFGLQGLTEALFLDVHKDGVRVSLITPGIVSTGFGGTAPEEWHLQPDDVADVVVAVLEADRRAAVNWVELRPAHPPVSSP